MLRLCTPFTVEAALLCSVHGDLALGHLSANVDLAAQYRQLNTLYKDVALKLQVGLRHLSTCSLNRCQSRAQSKAAPHV